MESIISADDPSFPQQESKTTTAEVCTGVKVKNRLVKNKMK